MAIAREERTNGEARTGGELSYRADRGGESNVRISTAICERIAAAEDVDVTELDVRLYDYVDVDALDTLFGGAGHASVELEFAVGEYVVSVRNDGEVAVSAGE